MWKSYQPSPSWLGVQCSAVSFRLLSFNFNSFDSATLIHSSHCCCSPTSFRLPSSLGFPFRLDVSSVTFSSQFPPASLKEQTQLIMQSIYNMLKQPVPSPPSTPLSVPLSHCRVHCSATCWFTNSNHSPYVASSPLLPPPQPRPWLLFECCALKIKITLVTSNNVACGCQPAGWWQKLLPPHSPSSTSTSRTGILQQPTIYSGWKIKCR